MGKMGDGFEGYRLSYVCRKNGKIKTVSGYFEEDLKYLIEDANSDRSFIAVVKEEVFGADGKYSFVPSEVLHGFLPENFELTGNGYVEVITEADKGWTPRLLVN